MKNCCDEYCSNYGCNQGKGCPARNTPFGEQKPRNEAGTFIVLGFLVAYLFALFLFSTKGL